MTGGVGPSPLWGSTAIRILMGMLSPNRMPPGPRTKVTEFSYEVEVVAGKRYSWGGPRSESRSPFVRGSLQQQEGWLAILIPTKRYSRDERLFPAKAIRY